MSLNFDKTYLMQFATKNSPQIDLDISYSNRLVSKACDTEFFGIDVGSTLSWKNHGEQITHTHTREGLLCNEIS